MVKTAIISDCECYRYELTRTWAMGTILTWVMLNPSTADANQDDPTIRKCIGFAKRWGYAGIRVVNLYAYRSTDPKGLKNAGYVQGPENKNYLLRLGLRDVVVAWGANAESYWPVLFASWYRHLKCLGVTKDGHPKHPLYVPYDTALVPFPVPAETSRQPQENTPNVDDLSNTQSDPVKPKESGANNE